MAGEGLTLTNTRVLIRCIQCDCESVPAFSPLWPQHDRIPVYGPICFPVCNADHAFCNLAVPKPTAKPALPTPKLFYCRNSAKHVKAVWKTAEESDSQKEETCGEVLQQVKTYWEAFQHELDSPNAKRLFNKCCDGKSCFVLGSRLWSCFSLSLSLSVCM